ncbi:MAG: hypothetical protein QNJ23_01445 [Woeseiaceae bacterium]|nr:hypothetical protein [Woeseiaceae bacterium]
MGIQRAFYVTQGALSVWECQRGQPRRCAEFTDSDAGLQDFDAYIAEHGELISNVIVDVIEEEFSLDNVPKLSLRDRNALLQRRLQRKFPRTPYRLPVFQKNSGTVPGTDAVVYSAVSNHELLEPWIRVMLRHEVPLAGIYSVPLMAPDLLRRIRKTQGSAMLVTQHGGQKLRQVFMHGKQVQSARLSQSPDISDPEYPQFILTEISRSRRYLERKRLTSNRAQLDVYIVAEADLAERILACHRNETPLQVHFVNPVSAARKLGLESPPSQENQELLYLAQSFASRPGRSYAVSGETRYARMRNIRRAVIGGSLATACLCSAIAGANLSAAWMLHSQSTSIERQLEQLTETFRRENERFDPLKADSHEMKLAVDTGDFILSNRLPVPWVMQQVGLVMGDYPDVQIKGLDWSVESAGGDDQSQQRIDRSMPITVPVKAIGAVRAEISADIEPFGGDMRKAFARIDALAADLEERTEFSRVVAVEYPLDASPSASIAGEITGDKVYDGARFRLQLHYAVNTTAAAVEEADDARF